MRTLVIVARLTIAAAVFFGSSCVSTHMKKYIGRDVRYIVLADGEPEQVMDMPDGLRAFQFRWGGGAVVIPARRTTDGQIQLVGNSAYYQERKLERPAVIAQTPGCRITYFAKWDAEKKGWIVVNISYPKKLAC